MAGREWVSDLDRQGAADAVVGSRRRLLRVEADRLALAAHWADLHAEDSVESAPWERPRVLPGSERLVLVGGDGTPEVGEFAVAELAVLMEVSLAAASSMMADALDLRHRLPLLWAGVDEGSVEAWKARKIAARVRVCGLSHAQALWVDQQATPLVGSLPWTRLWDRLEAAIVQVDPKAAEERRCAAAMARFVRTGQSNEYGLKTIVAKAAAGDAIFFVAMCDRLAQVLALEGDTDPVDVRRSKAVGILADPARALAMLQQHAALDDDGEPDADEPDAEDEDCGETEPVPATGASAGDRRSSTGSDDAPRRAYCTHCGSATGDPTPFVRPMRVDPAKLRPAATLFIHTSREAWERGEGVARVEGAGPVTLAQVVEMLGHTRVTVREVLDLAEDRPVDAYEVPERLREVLFQRCPGSAFPFAGGSLTRTRDVDHTVPYVAPDKGGPPGQTRISNLGFLDRRTHRVKTHAPGWRHDQPEPGVHYWRTPSGYWFRVDHRGSHALGKDDPTEGTGVTADQCWPLRLRSGAEITFSSLLAG